MEKPIMTIDELVDNANQVTMRMEKLRGFL